MTLSRVAGTLSIVAGIAWLVVFGPGVGGSGAAWLEGALWLFPVAFGLAAIALFSTGGSRLDRVAGWVAAGVASASAIVSIAGTALFDSGAPAYAAWLAWVSGIIVLCGLAVLYGARHVRDGRERHVAWIVLITGSLPFAFLLIVLGYKVATGWWVTDPALIAFGSLGAAVLVGGAWVAIGIGLWMRDPRPIAADASSTVG